MHATRTVLVVAHEVRPGRCRYCGAAIVWVTRASMPGRPAKTLPFTAPAPVALSTVQNPETGVRFEVWPTEALHIPQCPQPPARPRPPAVSVATRVAPAARASALPLFDDRCDDGLRRSS